MKVLGLQVWAASDLVKRQHLLKKEIIPNNSQIFLWKNGAGIKASSAFDIKTSTEMCS